MKKFLLSIFALMLAVFSVQAEEATLSFANKAQRTSFSSTKQVWEQNGVTFTNNKSSSTNAVADYAKPVRLYANSQLIVEYTSGNITKIVFDCNSSSYATALKNSIGTAATASSDKVTVTLDGKSNSFTVAKLTAQVRLDALTVTYTTAGEGGGETPEPEQPKTPEPPTVPTLTPSCNFDDIKTVEITNIADGATVYYTTDESVPSANNGTKYTGPFEIRETTTVKAIAVNEGGSSDVVSATYTKNEPLPDDWFVDVLNRELTGIEKSAGYDTWTGKKATSSAVYAGQSAGGNDAIQLRTTNNNSGIVTTKSGGKAKKIVVEWQSSTTEGRILDVYGNNTAYSAATDLYNNSNQGTKIGSIECGESTELTIDGDYDYIGLRSNSGAMYLKSVSITWDASNVVVVPDAPKIPATSDFVTSMDFEITNFSAYEDGTTVYYSIDGGDFIEYTTTFPITTSCEIVAYAEKDGKKSAEVRAEYTRIAKDPEINVLGDANADAFEGSIEVEIATVNGATAYYTLNGEEPTIESTEYEGTLTIKATATLKVIAIEAGEYESGVTTKDFVMAVTGSDNIEGESCTLSFANKDQRTEFSTSKQVWKQNGITLTNNKGKSTSNVGDYANPARFYKSSEIIVEFTSPIAKIEFACNTKAYASALNNSIPGSTVSDKIVTVQLDGTSKSFTINSLSEQIRIDALTVTYETETSASSFNLTIGNAGWATLFLDYAVEIPEGVTCYTVAEVNSEKVTLASVTDILPANTGVIVKANAGQYEFKPTDEDAEVAGLSGTTGNKYIFEDAYVLGIVDGVVGLYKADMAGGVWLNNANKAYLPASALPASAALSAGFRFDFDGTTAIEEVETEAAETVIYDLTGRRVNAITKAGVYVVNGKKILVK